MSEPILIALIVAIPTFLGSIWGAIKGIGTALRWWAEREEARITSDILGREAIKTVETKNQELTVERKLREDTERKLRDCLGARSGAVG